MNGGAMEDRTPDLRIANATLYQLSYDPNRAGTLSTWVKLIGKGKAY